jgi:lycopene cyclase domain-containing protein
LSYLNFLIVFLLPPLLTGAFLFFKSKSANKKYALQGMTVLAILALVYTTPWDNFLVANRVWWYGADRVLGTIGYVPIEEYCFFILQTYMTGFWTYLLWIKSDKSLLPLNRPFLKISVIVSLLTLELFSLLMLKNNSSFYMGLILSWSIPIVLVQLIAGFGFIAVHFKTFLFAFGLPSLYLCAADAFAIHNGIWDISKDYTLGVYFGPLPLEEATFFFVTNIMVAQGLLLFLYMKDQINIYKKALKLS